MHGVAYTSRPTGSSPFIRIFLNIHGSSIFVNLSRFSILPFIDLDLVMIVFPLTLFQSFYRSRPSSIVLVHRLSSVFEKRVSGFDSLSRPPIETRFLFSTPLIPFSRTILFSSFTVPGCPFDICQIYILSNYSRQTYIVLR